VTGGLTNVNDEEGMLARAEKYVPKSDTWITVAPLPEARWEHATVAVGAAMYVLGGMINENERSASAYKFDSTNGSWSQIAPMPEAKDRLCCGCH
jgi:N-acetylneuraminic acid mutarotase